MTVAFDDQNLHCGALHLVERDERYEGTWPWTSMDRVQRSAEKWEDYCGTMVIYKQRYLLRLRCRNKIGATVGYMLIAIHNDPGI